MRSLVRQMNEKYGGREIIRVNLTRKVSENV